MGGADGPAPRTVRPVRCGPCRPATPAEAGLAGNISDPANQAAVTKVALFSFAGFGRHDAGRAWSAAPAECAGGDARTVAALRAFADLTTYDGSLHRTQASALAAAASAFWGR